MKLSCICMPDNDSSKQIEQLMKKVSDACGSKNALAYAPHFSLRGDFEVNSENVDQLISDLDLLSLFQKPLT